MLRYLTKLGGGTHWSMMCYDRRVNKFFHYDSHQSMNLASSEKYKRAIGQIITNNPSNYIELVQCDSPQQSNGKMI